jgi:phosphopantothenoylcysteine decarboxylase/phosphopantothenate--cysteine ligase
MSDVKRVLLIVSGGIAAYKSLELIRLLRAGGNAVRCILTKGGAQFVTPLSLAALSGDTVYQDLFSLTDENDMGHIELSRDADLLLVMPASADILAKMNAGLADDLASTALLATDKPVLAAPAMNVRMWEHAATQDNVRNLTARGIRFIGPVEGDMACAEFGYGRMAEPADIAEAVQNALQGGGRLKGKRAVVTSGPTYEPIDPVRYLANRSSGRQGHAIARALAAEGAETILISGPTNLADPSGIAVRHVATALEMLAACEAELPADIVVCAAAVGDWRAAGETTEKLKKNGQAPSLELTENPDILATLAKHTRARPALVVGFAAETENLIEAATEKRRAKGCDWMLANDVSPGTGTFGGDNNTVHLIDDSGVEDWPTLTKDEVGRRLAVRIAIQIGSKNP